MTEFFVLREKPKLSFMLESSQVEIIDEASPRNSGIYSYERIDSVQYKEESINWWISILSNLLGFLGLGYVGEKYKDKASLIMKLSDQNKKIWLDNTDEIKVKEMIFSFNEKLKKEMTK